MNLVDAHCHLFMDPLGKDADGALERARKVGVTRVIVPAFDLASWDAVDALCAREGVYGALGLHPWAAEEKLDTARLRDRLSAPRIVALGEVGLDAKVSSPDRKQQVLALTAQLDVAARLGLPVVLHCRGAFEEMLRILKDYTPMLRGMMHAFSRGPELAQRFSDVGLHLSYGGSITRPHARRPRRSATTVAADRLLLETDAPSIGLEGIEPGKTEPRHVREIAREMAALRELSIGEIARITTANAERLFGI